MILFRKTFIFVAALLISISSGQSKDLKNSNPSRAGFDSDRLKRIDKMIQGCIDREEVPGAVGILIKDGKIGYHKAFGWADIESKKNTQKRHSFPNCLHVQADYNSGCVAVI